MSVKSRNLPEHKGVGYTKMDECPITVEEDLDYGGDRKPTYRKCCSYKRVCHYMKSRTLRLVRNATLNYDCIKTRMLPMVIASCVIRNVCWLIFVTLWIIEFAICTVFRLTFYLYWRVAGRLPEFIHDYIDDRKDDLNSIIYQLEARNDEFRQKLATLRTLETENGELQAKIDSLQSNVHTLEAEKQEALTRKDDLNSIIYQLEAQNDEFRQKLATLRTLESENGELQAKIDSLQSNVHTLEAEKQDALTRLSEVVSVKLRDNNPNIVDLNDRCRPTKLAEMFSELYDNEWTSAYTILEGHFGERRAIDLLIYIVMGAYRFCNDKADFTWSFLVEWFLDMNLPGAQQTSKWLKDSRKAKIEANVRDVEKDYEKKLLEKFKEIELPELLSQSDIHRYINKCIELSLLMVTTDPPVLPSCTGWTSVWGDQVKMDAKQQSSVNKQPMLFNKEIYKDYTLRGPYLDFVVWPALFLHIEGPLLSKGIAQGLK